MVSVFSCQGNKESLLLPQNQIDTRHYRLASPNSLTAIWYIYHVQVNAMIPDETVEEIRQHTDLVALAGEYVPLRKRGQNFLGLCPFHSEKTPSFAVHPARQIYHCFGCGVGGDAFDFVARIERTDFLGATKILAARAGVQVERVPGHEAERLRTEHKREREAASKLVELERVTFFEARQECHKLERLRRLAASRLRRIHYGAPERFRGEAELAWFALAEVAAAMPRAAASYSLMAFGPIDQRIDFAVHRDRRETLLEDVLQAGSVSNENGNRHEVQL